MSRAMGVTFSDAVYAAILSQAATEGSAVPGGPQAVVRRAVRDYLSRRGKRAEEPDQTDAEYAARRDDDE